MLRTPHPTLVSLECHPIPSRRARRGQGPIEVVVDEVDDPRTPALGLHDGRWLIRLDFTIYPPPCRLLSEPDSARRAHVAMRCHLTRGALFSRARGVTRSEGRRGVAMVGRVRVVGVWTTVPVVCQGNITHSESPPRLGSRPSNPRAFPEGISCPRIEPHRVPWHRVPIAPLERTRLFFVVHVFSSCRP